MQLKPEAERFCELIENVDPATADREAVAEGLALTLADLMAAAPRLPKLIEPETEDPLDFDLSRQALALGSRVTEVLGDWDMFWTTLDSSNSDRCGRPIRRVRRRQRPNSPGYPVLLGVGSMVSEVWEDLKRGLLALDAGASETDVLWDWQQGFYLHWGRHAVDLLRAMHGRTAC